MRRFAMLASLALAACGGLAWAPSVQAEEKERTADQIVKEINGVKTPEFDPAIRSDRAKIAKYLEARQNAMTRRSALIGELYKKDGNRVELLTLLPERWQAMLMTGPEKMEEVKKEIAEIRGQSKSAALKTEASFWSTLIAVQAGNDGPKALAAVESFVKEAPKDPRGSMLLSSAAGQIDDTAKQIELFKRVLKDYPESQAAEMASGSLKQLESVGKPFQIEFADAMKGTTVSMKGLKGKVVVLDFWATWCGPCVAELPTMKKIYAEYKDKGVEFIGVSLDQPKEEGGLDKLKEFVTKNAISWPQYYQGNGWASEFSKSWGINSIPAVFVIDTEGKLFSVNARGKLEDMIPELLKKAKKSEAGAGGGN